MTLLICFTLVCRLPVVWRTSKWNNWFIEISPHATCLSEIIMLRKYATLVWRGSSKETSTVRRWVSSLCVVPKRKLVCAHKWQRWGWAGGPMKSWSRHPYHSLTANVTSVMSIRFSWVFPKLIWVILAFRIPVPGEVDGSRSHFIRSRVHQVGCMVLRHIIDGTLYLWPSAVSRCVSLPYGIPTSDNYTQVTCEWWTRVWLIFAGMHGSEVVDQVKRGYRMPKPASHHIPDAIYRLMLQCWDADPDKRPTFEFLSHFLEDYTVTSELPYREVIDWTEAVCLVLIDTFHLWYQSSYDLKIFFILRVVLINPINFAFQYPWN